MLDDNSRIVLKYLLDICENGKYKLIELSDIFACFSKNTKIKTSEIKSIINKLENSGYISVKYHDDEVYCINAQPQIYQVLEKETNEDIRYKKIKHGAVGFAIIIFVLALMGSFLGTLIYNLIY